MSPQPLRNSQLPDLIGSNAAANHTAGALGGRPHVEGFVQAALAVSAAVRALQAAAASLSAAQKKASDAVCYWFETVAGQPVDGGTWDSWISDARAISSQLANVQKEICAMNSSIGHVTDAQMTLTTVSKHWVTATEQQPCQCGVVFT